MVIRENCSGFQHFDEVMIMEIMLFQYENW